MTKEDPYDICDLCKSGFMVPVASQGRFFSKSDILFPVPDDMAILTCDNCGEQIISGHQLSILLGFVDTQ